MIDAMLEYIKHALVYFHILFRGISRAPGLACLDRYNSKETPRHRVPTIKNFAPTDVCSRTNVLEESFAKLCNGSI